MVKLRPWSSSICWTKILLAKSLSKRLTRLRTGLAASAQRLAGEILRWSITWGRCLRLEVAINHLNVWIKIESHQTPGRPRFFFCVRAPCRLLIGYRLWRRLKWVDDAMQNPMQDEKAALWLDCLCNKTISVLPKSGKGQTYTLYYSVFRVPSILFRRHEMETTSARRL